MAENNSLHNVDPAENLHKKSHETGMQVGPKWINQRQQSALVSEDDRKTGKISDAANTALRNGQASTNL